ncbi:MAG: PcfJ domain-containing protein [Oscillospiraceae bacterium]|nr:PcfJ domain-containing protein [Oscillospiraceae bacterium]
MNPKCTLPEDLRRDALLEFDRVMLTCEEEQAAKRLFPQYLFFRNEYEDDGFHVSSTPIRLCTCTACGESFEAVRGNYARGRLHHEKCNCPHCGTEVEGIAAHKYKYDMPSLESWIKLTVARTGKDGAILIEAGNVRRRFTWDNLEGVIDWYPTKRYYFGKAGAVEFYEKVTHWSCGPFDPAEYAWTATKTVGDPFQPSTMGYADYDGAYVIIGLEEALERSHLKYCQIHSFYEQRASADLDNGSASRGIVKYLAWACVHPQIEMAVKLGLLEAVEDLVMNGKKNAKYLNWRATRPNELVRMSSQDAKIFFRENMDFCDLKDWKDCRTQLSFTKYADLADQVGGRKSFRELVECCTIAGRTPEQGVHYIRALQPSCARYAVPPQQIVRTWKDYLQLAKQLNLDLTERTVAMPKDLRIRHDAAAETIRVKENAEEMKKYRKRRRMLEKKYSFALGGLCVRVPTDTGEIVTEGRTLHHCVGGYAARHISGVTTILFIRHQRKPGRSFLTVELKEENGKIGIKQIHGYRNEGYNGAVDPEIRFAGFLETWLAWVNAGSERDRNGLPVLPETITTEVKSA